MKLVIDIKEEVYKSIQDNDYCGISNADMYNAIKNGIPHETVTEFADRCRECGREKVLDEIKRDVFNACSDNYHMPVYKLDCDKIFEIIDKYRVGSEDTE